MRSGVFQRFFRKERENRRGFGFGKKVYPPSPRLRGTINSKFEDSLTVYCIKKASLPLADLGLGHLFQDDFATNSNAFLLDIAVKQYLIPQNNENEQMLSNFFLKLDYFTRIVRMAKFHDEFHAIKKSRYPLWETPLRIKLCGT